MAVLGKRRLTDGSGFGWSYNTIPKPVLNLPTAAQSQKVDFAEAMST